MEAELVLHKDKYILLQNKTSNQSVYLPFIN